MVRFIFLIPLITAAYGFIGKKETHFTFESAHTSFTDRDDTLKINDLVFADFFSPNSDGYNDTYVILNIQNYPKNYLKVFNRWGEVVYHASPYLNLWDGKSNQSGSMLGKECTAGVYYFEFGDGEGNKATGKITLKR